MEENWGASHRNSNTPNFVHVSRKLHSHHLYSYRRMVKQNQLTKDSCLVMGLERPYYRPSSRQSPRNERLTMFHCNNAPSRFCICGNGHEVLPLYANKTFHFGRTLTNCEKGAVTAQNSNMESEYHRDRLQIIEVWSIRCQ